MRITTSSTALSLFGIVALLTACTMGRSNHQTPALTKHSSSLSQPVATKRWDIHSIDFANFTFPWPRDLGDSRKTFSLSSGELKPTRDDAGMVEEMGVKLRSVVYGDVTSDGAEDAIVVLGVLTGGSAIPHATYIYALEEEKPKLLWAISTGDRADGGLRRVYAEKGELVVERYSPVNSNGDCCPTLFTRIRYKWQDKEFQQTGKEETLPNSEGHSSPIMLH